MVGDVLAWALVSCARVFVCPAWVVRCPCLVAFTPMLLEHSQLVNLRRSDARLLTRTAGTVMSSHRGGSAAQAVRRVRGRLSGRAHAHLVARNHPARVLGVCAYRREGDPLDVVGEVGARAQAAEAVLGAVARTPGGSKS